MFTLPEEIEKGERKQSCHFNSKEKENTESLTNRKQTTEN
jgi:hypothetical protein